MGDVRRLRRWSAAAGAVAVFGVGLLGAAPAWAADTLEIKVDNSVQGKVGEKVQVRFTVKNNTKQPVNGVTVVVQAPGNATVDAADNPGCNVGGGGRTASCHSAGTLAADKSANGAIVLTVKTAGQAAGRISVEHGNADNFALRATGGPSPASTRSAKPTRTSSLSASETPGITDDGTFAPPEAGNGVAIQPTSDPATSRASDSGGMGLGLWVGIVAIVGALGLIGSLFYFRRKDRNEPDTGMHPVVPAPAGFPGSYGPAQPTTYGAPATPQTYGSPAAATQMINPGFGGATQAIPPNAAGPTQAINPGFGGPTQAIPPNQPPGSDQTVIFRRPDEF